MKLWHIIALLAIALLLFGGRRLPEVARGLARGLRIFRNELRGIGDDGGDTKPADPPDPPRDKPAQDASKENK